MADKAVFDHRMTQPVAIPKNKNYRVKIPSVAVGDIECLPGQTLIDFYRSELPAPTFRTSEEANAKTAEAKRRIFKLNNRSYER